MRSRRIQRVLTIRDGKKRNILVPSVRRNAMKSSRT